MKMKCTESWQLRSHMMFVVDNLQYYLMADVLESQFSQLLDRLHQSTNFEELRHSHDIFLSSVISNTFVNNKPVNQCLTELLQCCITYCHLVECQGTDHNKGTTMTKLTRQTSVENLLY